VPGAGTRIARRTISRAVAPDHPYRAEHCCRNAAERLPLRLRHRYDAHFGGMNSRFSPSWSNILSLAVSALRLSLSMSNLTLPYLIASLARLAIGFGDNVKNAQPIGGARDMAILVQSTVTSLAAIVY